MANNSITIDMDKSIPEKPDNTENLDASSISDDSISEHITSNASMENDRSINEIEIINEKSALLELEYSNKIYQDEKPIYVDVLPNDGVKNAKSILEEILADTQFDSDESFNVFANLDLSDKVLLNSITSHSVDIDNNSSFKKVAEEIVAVKDFLPAQDLEDLSNPTYTLSMVSATEYRQLQEDCNDKLIEYNSAITYKNNLIHQLTESLEQSVAERKELFAQLENFKVQVAKLQLQLQETGKMLKTHNCECNDGLLLLSEIKELQGRIDYDKNMHSKEIASLRNLLEAKHTKEVEELRTYFEKKCVELEKNYSEEIFSQQSRKLSDSGSELELSAEFLLSSQPGPGGDHNRVFKSKEDVEKFKENLNNFLFKLNRHSMEDLTTKTLANIEIEVKCELNGIFNIGEKLEIQAIENKYLEEISNLKYQLDERDLKKQDLISISSTTIIQDVENSGEIQLSGMIESYERRLEEQVSLAKIDIINELETRIKNPALNDGDDKNWNSELLSQLYKKFVQKYEQNNDFLKERDYLKRQVQSLRNLLKKLVCYFAQAEDEINNTLVETLIKQTNDNLIIIDDAEINLDGSSGDTTNSSKNLDNSFANKTRVHLTPNFDDLISLVEGQNKNYEETSLDISVELKNCLDRLRQDAYAILASTTAQQFPSLDLSVEGNSVIVENQQKAREELIGAHKIITMLKNDKEVLEIRIDQLLRQVNVLESEIADLTKHGYNEVISEGYGEEGTALQGLDTTKVLADLQEKARTMLAQCRTSVDLQALELIEELCRVGEKIKEESQKEAGDLLRQIDVADKKYKTTQRFLEEQAAEREEERDDAQKKISLLIEQLKNRDKDRINSEMMSNEAEQLEKQIKVLESRLTVQEEKYKELEVERDEAVEKIKIHRDIIKDLEQLNDSKDCEIGDHLRNVEQLKCIVNQQHHSLDQYSSFNTSGNILDIQNLRKHCEDLEGEVEKLRIVAELVGNEGAFKQIQIQLLEIEKAIDKSTRELELLHSTDTNSCSSPSEDMSVRDLVCSQNPNSLSVMDECEIPLQQLTKLKEKLLRHSRAEDAAVKRIHDLEMQISTLKLENEEIFNEKDLMKRQLHEQLVLISDLQIRLDQQRIKTEHIEKQTNTSLETKIYDLQNKILDLEEKLRSKGKFISSQELIIEESVQRIRDLEADLSDCKEDDLIIKMQKELELLKLENHSLKGKNLTDKQILPNLVENIIQDKNSEIEKLREILFEREKDLSSYTSLNLNKSDFKILANLKEAGGSIEQVISILDLSQLAEMPDRVRHCITNKSEDFVEPDHQFSLKKIDHTVYSEPSEISAIEKIGPHFNYTLNAPSGKPNSTEIHQKSSEKRVRFEDTGDVQTLLKETELLKQDINRKNSIISDMEAKLSNLNGFEDKIKTVQLSLEQTEESLVNAKKTLEKDQKDSEERERRTGVELAEKKIMLFQIEKELNGLKEDSLRKDEMYLKLAEQKRNVETELNNIKNKSNVKYEEILEEKNLIIDKAETELQDLKNKLTTSNEKLYKLEKELLNKTLELEQLNSMIEKYEKHSKNNKTDLMKLQQDMIENKNVIEQLNKDVNNKQTIIVDRDCYIEILNEDLKFYQNHISELEDKLKFLQENSSLMQTLQDEKLKVVELKKQGTQLEDLIREKEKIIRRMTEDQNQVHQNIKVIDNKIKETGNIFDLSNRLKMEQQKNADLFMEVHKLKASLLNFQIANTAPVEDITVELRRELECAAQIDSNILNAVSDQSINSFSEEHDSESYMRLLIRQKNENKKLLRNNDRLEEEKILLEQQWNNGQVKLKEIETLLEKEKLNRQKIMIEDAKLIEQLRIKLDSIIEYRQQLENALQEERSGKNILENSLEDMKKCLSNSESTKYKLHPTEDQMELTNLKTKLQITKADNEKLIKKTFDMQRNCNEFENALKYTKEILVLETERNRAQEEKLRIISEKEKILGQELLRKKFELELKERTIDEQKIQLDQIQQEKGFLKRQKSELIKVLKEFQTPYQSEVLMENRIVPETLENIIKELKEKSEENKKKIKYIEQIEREKTLLEIQLKNQIKFNLYNNLPFGDLVARCDYLFAKSLKLESIRKSLIWQKQYLVEFLKCHQRICLIEDLPNGPHEQHCLKRRRPPIQHFRAAVYMIISIYRMKFLVRRWNSGVRNFANINSRHYQKSKENYIRDNSEIAANFQVGQLVSNQNFAHTSSNQVNNILLHPQTEATNYENAIRPLSPSLSAEEPIPEGSWSGNTPPSKEHHPINHPLRAPQLLTQLHERVEKIQDKLSLSTISDRY